MTKISRRSFLKGIGVAPLYVFFSSFLNKFKPLQASTPSANSNKSWLEWEEKGVIPKGSSAPRRANKAILKVRIKREQSKARTRYTYPPEYDASKIQVLCYESSLPENAKQVVARGNKDEYLLGIVKGEDVTQFLKSPDIEEVTEEYALQLGSAWTRQTELVTDNNKVLAIYAKSLRGERLSRKDLQALDPKHPERGINLSRSFKETLDKHLSA